MKKVIKYGLQAALDAVVSKDYVTHARRVVNTAAGKKWFKDSVAVESELSLLLADELEIDEKDVTFIWTGRQCFIYFMTEPFYFITPYSLKKVLENLTPAYEGAA